MRKGQENKGARVAQKARHKALNELVAKYKSEYDILYARYKAELLPKPEPPTELPVSTP